MAETHFWLVRCLSDTFDTISTSGADPAAVALSEIARPSPDRGLRQEAAATTTPGPARLDKPKRPHARQLEPDQVGPDGHWTGHRVIGAVGLGLGDSLFYSSLHWHAIVH